MSKVEFNTILSFRYVYSEQNVSLTNEDVTIDLVRPPVTT